LAVTPNSEQTFTPHSALAYKPEPSKFCETYDFYQFPHPMLFRTVLAKAIAKFPIMTSWHRYVVGEALSGEAPYLRRVNLDITDFGLRLGNAHYRCGRVASPHPDYILPAYKNYIDHFVAEGGGPSIPQDVLGSKGEYLKASFDEVQTQCGGIEGYFENGLG
jgi:hypothetical protein